MSDRTQLKARANIVYLLMVLFALAIAVKLLVIDAIRNTVSGVTGRFDSRSWTPTVVTCTSSPSTTMPNAAPGRPARGNDSRSQASIFGNASASFWRRAPSRNTGGGTVAGAISDAAVAGGGATAWAAASAGQAATRIEDSRRWRMRLPTTPADVRHVEMQGLPPVQVPAQVLLSFRLPGEVTMQKRNVFGRGLALATLTLATLAGPAVAQDRVSVAMRNSGEVVTGTFEDLNNDIVYVRVSLHDQRRLPLGGILLLDFTGDPRNLPEAERNDARGGDHLLVMRNGGRSRGRLLNIEGGEGSSKPDEPRIISFRTVDGEERRVRPSDVARIYLGNYPAPQRPTPQPDQPTERPEPAPGPGLSVPANRAWTSTGIFVRQGDLVRFNASGQVQLSGSRDDVATPAGSTSGRMAPGSPVNALAGALIGRVGNGAPFGIGNQTEVRMPDAGELWLGVNDNDVNDNRGEFRVEVTPQGGQGGRRPRR